MINLEEISKAKKQTIDQVSSEKYYLTKNLITSIFRPNTYLYCFLMKKLKMQFLQNGIIQHVSLPKLSQHNPQVFHQRRKFACVTFSVERAKEFGIKSQQSEE